MSPWALRSPSLAIKHGLRRHKERMSELDKADKAFWRDDVKAIQERTKDKAKLMALESLKGVTVAQLAEKYRVSPRTVRQRLKYAQKMKLIDHHVSSVIRELVPNALGVYELAMTDIYHEVNPQVVNVATKILEGSGVFRKGVDPLTPPSAEGEPTTIEEYRAWRITRTAPPKETEDEDGEHGTGGGRAVLNPHPEDPGGYVDGDVTELPEGGDGGSQDPAGSHPQD